MPLQIPDYRDKHSMSFGDAGRNFDLESIQWMNTWTRWHMVPTSRPVVNPPQAITEYDVLPDRNGIIDETDQLDSGIYYGLRKGSWEFVVLHEYNGLWYLVYEELLGYVHGQELRVQLADDPNWYYVGRIFVNQWKSDPHASKVVLDYELDPYKYSISTTGDYDWRFDDAVSMRRKELIYSTFFVEGTKYRDILYNGTKPAKPVIVVPSNDFTVEYNGKIVQLKQGTARYKELKLKNGHNYMIFHGLGQVSLYANLGVSL